MNFKTTLVLALVLTVGIVAVVLLDKHDDKQKQIKELEGKVLAIENSDITGLAFEPTGISCIKDSTGWQIIRPVQAQGDESALEGIVDFVTTANIERTISSDPTEYNVFGLEPAQSMLIISHPQGADTVFVGDKSPTGGFQFARKSGSPQVFLTSTSVKSNADKTLFDLRNKKVLSFTKSDVRTIKVQNKNNSFTLQKSGDSWNLTQPATYKADATEVDKILNRLNSERVKEFRAEAPGNLSSFGLHAPVTKVELLIGNDPVNKTLLIGKDDGDQYCAYDESRSPVFMVDSAFVNILNVDLFTLRDKQIARFEDAQADSIVLEFSGQTIVCTKDTSDTWLTVQPEIRTVKSWEMRSLLSTVSDLKAQAFVENKSLAACGLDRPQAKATFYSNGFVLLDLELGKSSGESVYTKVTGLDPVYKVEQNVFDRLTPDLDDFCEQSKENN